MAYSRWSTSNWYIFWLASSATRKQEEKLVVWHVDHAGEEGTTLAYPEVKKLVKRGRSLASLDGRLPGYRRQAEPLLRECFRAFVESVDEHYAKKHR